MQVPERGDPPSEGVCEDVGAVPVGEEDEGPRVSRALVLGGEYDDPGEPEEGDADEGAPLNATGVHLCALASPALFLLCCPYAQGSAPASPYI